MTQTQRIIISVLSIIALALTVTLGMYIYRYVQSMAQTPLGPVLPLMPTQALPPTWTAIPRAQAQANVTQGATATALPATPSGPMCGGPGTMNILVIGTDSRADSYLYGLGDAIRLVRVDFATPKVSALEFPRDLWVEIPHISDNLNGQDHEKLNQAYLYGQPGFQYWDDPSEGSGLTALTLNKNFGANIDHYVTVNMRTFEHIIDAMGGIEVEITNEDVAKTSGLSIGTHTLNGAQALKLARNRSGGLFERADNQNLVLCAVRKKLTNPNIVAQIPALIETFRDNIRTDLTPEQLGQLACLAARMPGENIILASFPGDLFKQTRVYDPVFEKRIAIAEADFAILTDFVTRFQAGSWPVLVEAAPATIDEEDAPVICQ